MPLWCCLRFIASLLAMEEQPSIHATLPSSSGQHRIDPLAS
jgi:hypothetical protein